MAEPPWFESWFDSPYYHQLYFERDELEADDFIRRLLDYLKPEQGARALDVACGKGRHSRMLAARGLDITGIDLSEESIQSAKTFAGENLHFYKHDMRLPFWINYFDLAFNFFTSFGYFHFKRENDAAIRTIAHSLRSGGLLVMDYLNTHFVESHLVHQEEKHVGDVTFYITRWLDENFFYKKIEVEDEALREPLIFTEQVSKFSLGDFNDMFSFQGLQIQEVFGDYNLGHYDVRQSPRMIMIAKKIRV